MVERLLTQEQRQKYNRLLATKGKQAADEFKSKVTASDDPAPKDPKPKKKGGGGLPPEDKKFLKELKNTKKVGEKAGLTGNPDLIESPAVDALTDPNNPAFIGAPSEAERKSRDDLQKGVDALTNPDGTPKISQPAQEGLDALKDLMEKVGLQSPEMADFIKKLSDNYDTAGERPEDVKAALEMAKNNVEAAGKEDPRLTNLFSVMEKGLMGLSAPENQAMRESMTREIQGDYVAKQRKLNDVLARSRVTGGAALSAMNKNDKDNSDRLAKAEQDLLLKNIDIQDKRRGEYGDALMTNDANLKTAKNAAVLGYTTALNQATANESDAKAKAGTLLSTTLTNDEQTRLNAKVSATGNFGNAQVQASANAQEAQARAREAAAKYIQDGDYHRAELLLKSVGLSLDVEKYNQDKKTADKTAVVSLYTGKKGIDIADQTAKTNEKLVSQAGSGGGGGGGGEPDTSGVEEAANNLEEGIKGSGKKKKKKKK